jgi:hypothetical protein
VTFLCQQLRTSDQFKLLCQMVNVLEFCDEVCGKRLWK